MIQKIFSAILLLVTLNFLCLPVRYIDGVSSLTAEENTNTESSDSKDFEEDETEINHNKGFAFILIDKGEKIVHHAQFKFYPSWFSEVCDQPPEYSTI